jgi:hypothetical protein
MADKRSTAPLKRKFMRLSLAGLLAAVGASPVLANHSWNGYHWSRTSTLNIRVGDNVGPAWDAYLRSAAVEWTKATPLDVTVVASSVDPVRCTPTYGRVEACNAAYGANGWLGIGQVWISGGHIVQGVVQVNDTYFSQAFYSTPAWRELVMCQELGHVLGLDHQDVVSTNLNLGSCMDYTNDPAGVRGTNGTLSNQRPNQHDFDQLAAIHAHTDASQLASTRATSSTSAARVPPGGQGKRFAETRPGQSAREWGQAVAADARGRPRLFVRNLGQGDLVATFVIWAEDAEVPHMDDHNH